MNSANADKGPVQRLINWGYSHFVYPTFEPLTAKGLHSRMKEVEARERLSLQENKELQWRDLQKLLKHAVDTCPFYKKRFDTYGIRLEQLQAPEDLRVIPPITRDDLRQYLPDIISRKFATSDLHSAATGGTTDTPVPIVRSSASLEWKTAVQFQFNSWAGMLPGDKVFNLWGARQDYSENPSFRWRLYDRHLMRRIWAPTSLLNRDVLEQYRLMLNQLRPRIIYAYPTPLSVFCEYLLDCGKSYHRPKAAICTAELLYPSQRSCVEKALGCGVFEHYGSREFGMIAGECEAHNGMHYNPMAAYMDFVPVENSEFPDMHEVFVTDILNYGMPLIRYKVNDCAVLGDDQCTCGRGYPMIRQIIGRTGDVFRLPNGDRIPGVAFTNRVLKVCPGLAKTQIIQEKLNEFRIRYVPGPSFSEEDLAHLRQNLKRFVQGEVTWIFEQVTEIPRERSGKTRFCISRVKDEKNQEIVAASRD
jgi:phenylacetate-CoA ligase